MNLQTLTLLLPSLSLKENEAENHVKYAFYIRAFNLLPRNAVCRPPPEKGFHFWGTLETGFLSGKEKRQRMWSLMSVLSSHQWCKYKVWVPYNIRKSPLCYSITAFTETRPPHFQYVFTFWSSGQAFSQPSLSP